MSIKLLFRIFKMVKSVKIVKKIINETLFKKKSLESFELKKNGIYVK